MVRISMYAPLYQVEWSELEILTYNVNVTCNLQIWEIFGRWWTDICNWIIKFVFYMNGSIP